MTKGQRAAGKLSGGGGSAGWGSEEWGDGEPCSQGPIARSLKRKSHPSRTLLFTKPEFSACHSYEVTEKREVGLPQHQVRITQDITPGAKRLGEAKI